MPANNVWAFDIKSQKQNLIDRWSAEVRNEVQPAKGQEAYALLNSVPLVIDGLADILKDEVDPDAVRHLHQDIASIHGLARSQQEGYRCEHIASEYKILRRLVLEALDQQAGKLPELVHDLLIEVFALASHRAQQTLTRALATKASPPHQPWHLDENLSRMIIEEVEDYAIFMVDLHGHIASWNKGTFMVKGYQAHEIIGQPFRTLFTEEDAAVGRPEWELDYAKKHGRYAGEGWRQRKDGSRFWASVVLTALHDASQELIGWVKITRDLTAEKRMQEELQRAEAATQAKSAFLANMSHEIRTPLGVIMGFAELLNDTTLSAETRLEVASTIKRNGEQLLSLIDAILDLSKVEAGKLTIEKGPIDVPEFLDDIYKTLHAKAAAKGLDFSIDSSSGLPQRIFSDRMRLRQILLNMVGNAIKFTDHGFVRLKAELRLAADATTHDRLLFYVTDSGCGISSDYQKKLFAPFTQAPTTTKNMLGGTGLGLSLSRQLAQALGGDLMLIESRPGEGSCFLLSTNTGAKDQVVWTTGPSGAALPTMRSEKARQEAKRLDGTRILVAEDALDNQKLISSFLRSAGAEVVVVSNGAEAVQAACSSAFDLVLMDIQMPQMDGYEATSSLREKCFDRPIVALTALAMNEERERGHDFGFDDYLTKPINRAALLKTINRLTEKRRRLIVETALRTSGEQPSSDHTGRH